jgi:hypothetical protein
MQAPTPIFRKVALERLSTPERLDELIQVTTPRGWLSLLAFWTIVVVAALWGFFGSIPTVVQGSGIMIRDGSINVIESPASGQVFDLYVKVGDVVQVDQLVARVVQEGDASRDGGSGSRTVFVLSKHAGRVFEMRVDRGQVIQPGQALMSVEQPGRALETVLYLTPVDGKKVQPGMQVQIAPAPVKQEEYGRMLGRVTSVGEFPATAAAMKRVLGSDELVKTMSQNGAPIEIHVEMMRSPNTASGYEWTSTVGSAVTFDLPTLVGGAFRSIVGAESGPGGRTWSGSPGPPVVLATGTFCSAEVIVDDQAPITLVFAKLNR